MDEVKTQSQKRKCLWRLFFFFFFDAGFVIDTGHKQTLRRFPFNPPWLIIDKAADSRASAVICRRTQRCLVRGFFLSSFFFIDKLFLCAALFCSVFDVGEPADLTFFFFFSWLTHSQHIGAEKNTHQRVKHRQKERERGRKENLNIKAQFTHACVCVSCSLFGDKPERCVVCHRI